MMSNSRPPFDNIGIPAEVGDHTLRVVERLLEREPDSSVDIQTVSEETGYLPSIVKEVFYALLAFRLLKGTFQPRHKACGNIVGPQEPSAQTVRQKAAAGHYVCPHCMERVEGPEDIEIQIVFWRPGATVDF